MAPTIQDADLSGDLGGVYEDAIDYLEDTFEGQEEDGEFEEALEEFPEEIIECTDIVAEQRYDAEGALVCRFEGKQYWRKDIGLIMSTSIDNTKCSYQIRRVTMSIFVTGCITMPLSWASTVC